MNKKLVEMRAKIATLQGRLNEAKKGEEEKPKLRKVKGGEFTSADGKKKAVVYKDADWGEYRVKHYEDGKHKESADYHDEDKESAFGTAKHFVGLNEGVAYLIEAAVDRAELVLAAKSITGRIQDVAEDMAKVEANDLMPMMDSLKANFGPEVSDRFENVVSEQVRGLIEALKTAKDTIGTEILRLERAANGEGTSDLDSLDMADETGMDASLDDPAAGDDFAADMGDANADADFDMDADAAAADAVGDDDLSAAVDDFGDEGTTAAGRNLKDSVQHEGANALRESSNPDRLVARAFVKALREGKGAVVAAKFVAEAFSIDVADVVEIVQEAKQVNELAPASDKETRKLPFDDRAKAQRILDRFAVNMGLKFDLGAHEATITGSARLLDRVADEFKVATMEGEEETYRLRVFNTATKDVTHNEKFVGTLAAAERKLGDLWNDGPAGAPGRGWKATIRDAQGKLLQTIDA